MGEKKGNADSPRPPCRERRKGVQMASGIKGRWAGAGRCSDKKKRNRRGWKKAFCKEKVRRTQEKECCIWNFRIFGIYWRN